VKLPTDKTDEQTDKRQVKHNLLGGGVTVTLYSQFAVKIAYKR